MAETALKAGLNLDVPAHARAVLKINLNAARRNWRKLNNMTAGAICGAVVKADAYGLGLDKVIPAIASEGCDTFFVATLEEGKRVRNFLANAQIYVLDGLIPGSEAYYNSFDLRPVLSSVEEARDWAYFCRSQQKRLPAAIQVDTGMNRLGLSFNEFMQITGERELLQTFKLTLLISHLACADTPDSHNNKIQLESFERARRALPDVPCSLANSAGVFLGSKFHFDVVRPGIAIYGGRAFEGKRNPMECVAELYGRILQLRHAKAGETVGYGAVHHTNRPTKIATVSVGYADGFLRSLGGNKTGPGPSVYIASHKVPVVGRVSMDLITIDVTDVPSGLVQRGGWVEMIGTQTSVDDLADFAGTIGYEILTRLGHRAHRVYAEHQG